MKRWIRLTWLNVSGAWFIRLQLIPVLMWARWPLLDPPHGLALWFRILRDWRHGWLLFLTLTVITLGFVLEVARQKAAAWCNVGFYAAYVLFLSADSLVAFLRHELEPEAVLYLVAFGGSALIILVINFLLYRRWRGAKSEQND